MPAQACGPVAIAGKSPGLLLFAASFRDDWHLMREHMQILTRYILAELLKTFVLALCVLTLLMLLFAVVMDLLPRGVDAALIVKLLPYLLPEAVRNAAQGALLLAACSVFGRLAANNELLAIKSLGITPLATLGPVLIIAFLLSLMCVWLYDMGEYWGQNGIRRKVVQSVEQVAYGKLRSSRSYSTPRFSLSVKRLDGNRLIQPTLFYQPPDETEAVSITAAEGQLRSNLDEMTLSVVCYNGSATVGDKVTMVFPDKMEQVIPLESVTQEKVTWRDVNRSLRMIRSELVKEKRHAAQLAQYCLAQSPTGQHVPSVAIGQEELAESRLRICWLETLSYRRWANGFFCLAYVMLGVPVAMLLRSGDHLSNFFVCFLPILLVNYPLHAIFIQLAQAGNAPSWTPWAGNVLMMLAGIWLLRKSV